MVRSTNKQEGLCITMHAAPLSIATLYSQIEQASNKEMATVITKAFEQVEANQKELATHTKQETLKEVNLQDLATKADLKAEISELRHELKADIQTLEAKFDTKMAEQKLELFKEISSSKWQVVGSIIVLFFAQIILKHFSLI